MHKMVFSNFYYCLITYQITTYGTDALSVLSAQVVKHSFLIVEA